MTVRPDDGDRGEDQYLTHRQHRVAHDLSGQQRSGRDRGDEQLNHARLLLLHDALGDRAAEQRCGEQEDDAEADRHEVAEGGVAVVGVEELHGRHLRECQEQLRRRIGLRDDREAQRRGRVAHDCGIDLARGDEGLGLSAVGDVRDVEVRSFGHVLSSVAGDRDRSARGVARRDAAPYDQCQRSDEQDRAWR